MAKKVSIKATDLEKGQTAKFQDVTYKNSDDKVMHVRVLAADPEEGPGEDETEPSGPGGGPEPCHDTNPDGSGGPGGGGWGGGGFEPTRPNPDGTSDPNRDFPAKQGKCF